ncbi:MAG: hypothetical protein ACR2PI_00995 [Hyphomicrobiaceae bacterium]
MTTNAKDRYVTFHPDIQVMEVDFCDLTFEVPAHVHAAYDSIEGELEQTGQKWFFLVNYKNCQIDSSAWIAFAHRGKKVNLAYSLGSARFAAPGDTGDAILESARQKEFDPNLFTSRDEALAHLDSLRRAIPSDAMAETLVPTPPKDARTPDDRIFFHPNLQVMEVDYSDYSFATSASVNDFYDEITRQIAATERKWYFMVNYENTEVLPDAWYTWAARGRTLNDEFSLGTVRFNPKEETKEQLQKRGRMDDFNPNVVSSREEALERVEELKRA